MKLLVTGGAGFIGSNFIHHILNTYPNYEVVNLDLLTYAGNLGNLMKWENDPRYTFVKGDICDSAIVEDVINGVDLIVHFAAESHVDRSIADATDFVRTNVVGTHVLLEAVRKKNIRFHHISTDEVFGYLGPDDPAFHEKTPYNPRSPYSASKAASDHLVRVYHNTYKIPITISNCSNNYGPFQFPEKFISLAITNILENQKIPVYGDGLQIRDWLYVSDHCKAIDVIIHKGEIGETYCIGGDNQPTNLDVIKRICAIFGKDESVITFVKDRPGHDRRYAIDHTKITKDLGWKPSVDLETGLSSTIEWYKNNEAWWKRLKKKAV